MRIITLAALIMLVAGIALLDVILGALGVSALAFTAASALADNLPPETLSPSLNSRS
ncbi:hypothetical protein [Pseudomonas sp. NPDC096950]|uniref:hypothetical protein n=1 Tax=Pseudomonas sp. NPDC096950 TaxID=3364485 RepID=UPI00383B834C